MSSLRLTQSSSGIVHSHERPEVGAFSLPKEALTRKGARVTRHLASRSTEKSMRSYSVFQVCMSLHVNREDHPSDLVQYRARLKARPARIKVPSDRMTPAEKWAECKQARYIRGKSPETCDEDVLVKYATERSGVALMVSVRM